MKHSRKTDKWALRRARSLSNRVERIVAAHPEVDRDNVRHTLILLQYPPLERLRRGLIRGRATSVFRSKIAANRPKDKLTIPVLQDALTTAQSLKKRKTRKTVRASGTVRKAGERGRPRRKD